MPAPPSAEIIAAHQAGFTEIFSRVDFYEADLTTLWMASAPHIDGSVSVDSNRDERRTASVSFANDDGKLKTQPNGFWYDKVARIYRGIRYRDAAGVQQSYELQLGEFFIDDIDSASSEASISVTMRDAARKLMQAKFAVSTEFASGVSIESVINAIAINGGITSNRISLPSTGVNTGRAFLFDRTTERWKAIKEIATAYGYDVYFDNTGTLTMSVFADPSNPAVSPSVFTFETGSRDIRNGNFEDLKKSGQPKAFVYFRSGNAVPAMAGILTSLGYAVTSSTTAPTLVSLTSGGFDIYVADQGQNDVSGANVDIAYAAYNAGINVFMAGNDTTATAGCPIWAGTTQVSASQLQPTFPRGVGNTTTEYWLGVTGAWPSFTDTDNTRYFTSVRGTALAFAGATYTVDSSTKLVGVAEDAGGTTAAGLPARWVFIQANTYIATDAMYAFLRRAATWLDAATPSWWQADTYNQVWNAAATPGIERINPRSGSYAIKHSIATGQGAFWISEHSAPVNPGDVYELSAWSRGMLTSGARITANTNYLRAYFGATSNFTPNGTDLGEVLAAGPWSTDWSQAKGQITVPAGMAYMRVAMFCSPVGGDATVWWDDVEVSRVQPTPDIKGNLVNFTRKVSSARIYNHVVVSGESTETLPVYNQVENTTVTSPTRIAKLGRRTYFYTSSFITTTGQALSVATNFLRKVALEQFEVGVDSIVMPWLEPGSIVTLDDPESLGSDPVRFLLADITIPLKPGSMQGNLRRVTVVG